MDSERLIITPEAADLINKTKKSGHKVLAVGITTIRGLETYTTTNDEVNAYDGWTNKFIFPPYRFAIPMPSFPTSTVRARQCSCQLQHSEDMKM